MEERPKVIDYRTTKFFRMTREVIYNEDNGLKPVDIVVYSILCMYANNDSLSSYPSIETISKKARCSIRTVYRSLRELEDSNYISIKNRHDVRGFKTSNEYTILDVTE